MTTSEIASLALDAYDAAATADRAAYTRANDAAKAVDAARAALARAIAERDRATAASETTFAVRTAAFKAWDAACNA